MRDRPDVKYAAGPAASNGQPKKCRAKSQRFEIINNFMDAAERHLRPVERQVWLHMWRLAKADNTVAVSFTTLSKRSGVTRKYIQDAVRSLVEKRLLRIIFRGGPNHSTNRYVLLAPAGWSPAKERPGVTLGRSRIDGK